MLLLAFAVLLVAGPCELAIAQSSQSYEASNMWGTTPAGIAVPGAAESAVGHSQNGIVAGQVNAAEQGLLTTTGDGGSIAVTSVGSQTIVSNTILGNSNSSNIDATQRSTNTGSVENTGEVNAN